MRMSLEEKIANGLDTLSAILDREDIDFTQIIYSAKLEVEAIRRDLEEGDD